MFLKCAALLAAKLMQANCCASGSSCPPVSEAPNVGWTEIWIVVSRSLLRPTEQFKDLLKSSEPSKTHLIRMGGTDRG
jgi:hypothetical protein